MSKKIVSLATIGFGWGVTLSMAITIMISLFYPDGKFYAVVPELALIMGSEINAVILQFILSGLLGSCSAVISLIWKIDSWSFLKQNVVYFLLLMTSFLSTAYLLYWMEHDLTGIFHYVLIFIMIFIFTWILQYSFLKFKIKAINNQLNK